MADHSEVKVYLVDGNHVLPSIVLLASCKETLSEEESRDPELGRGSVVDPILHELEPCNEVVDPGS